MILFESVQLSRCKGQVLVKFVFSKKAIKNDEIFIVNLTLHDVKSKVKISSIFVTFLENMNFNVKTEKFASNICGLLRINKL